jgi:uncharacterized OB-fold protein
MFFILIIKALFVVFIVGLIGVIVAWIKDNIFTKEEKESIKEGFLELNNRFHRVTCVTCGETQKPEWKICPYCGENNNMKSKESSDNISLNDI